MALSSLVFIEPAPYDILAILLFAMFFSFGLRIPKGIGFALLLLGLFIIANVMASIFSQDPVGSIIYMTVTVFLLITWLFFTSIIYENPEQAVNVIWNGYVVAAIFTVMMGMLAYFRLLPNSELFLYEGRASGTFKDANVYGPFLVPVVLYLGSRLGSETHVKMWRTLAILMFILLGLLLSFSRGAWANLAISAFVYILLHLSIKPSPTEILKLGSFGVLTAVLSISIIVWAISTPQVSELFTERARLFQSYDVERGGRFSALGDALEKSFENPVGIGPGQARYFFTTEPHNLYLHIFVETGWLGGITFCLFLIITIWRSFLLCFSGAELKDTHMVVLACLIGLLVESLIIHSTHWRHLYLLLAMSWGLILAYESHKLDSGAYSLSNTRN